VKLFIASLAAATTLFSAPKVEAIPQMTESNAVAQRECKALSNRFIKWENQRWKEGGKRGPQPRRYEGVNVIPSSWVTGGGSGHIRLACGMVKTHWNSGEEIYTQLFQEKGPDGDYWDKAVWTTGDEAVSKHNSYIAAYNGEVRRYNAEVDSWNAKHSDSRSPMEIARCRGIYGSGINMITIDWCTGESW